MKFSGGDCILCRILYRILIMATERDGEVGSFKGGNGESAGSFHGGDREIGKRSDLGVQ